MEAKKTIYSRRRFINNLGVSSLGFCGFVKKKFSKKTDEGMNDVIRTITQHRSIRHFQDKELSEKMKQTLLKCAVRAPTTAMGHFYSIIEIKDAEIKHRLYELCGRQQSVKQGTFFIFTVDLRRSRLWADHLSVKRRINEFTALVFGTTDATLAAQNFSLAAESLGLGTVFIGMIGHRAMEVCGLLQLPPDVLPIYGVVVGYPDENPVLRPRIPVKFMHHVDYYRDMQSKEIEESIDAIGNWSSGERVADRNKTQKRELVRSILTGGWWIEGEKSLKKALHRQSWFENMKAVTE